MLQGVSYIHQNTFIRFFQFWYGEAVSDIWKFFSELLREANYQLAPLLMLKMLFVPLFGDYTTQGVVVGVLFRLVRMLAGTMVLAFLAMLALTVLVLWIVLPPLSLFSFINSLAFSIL